MWQRILGILKFDARTYHEIKMDEGATGQAALVVLIVAFGTGLGLGVALFDEYSLNMIGTIGWTFVGWLLMSIVLYIIGAKLMGSEATLPQVLRLIGFGFIPQLLGVLSIIPFCGFVFSIVALTWSAITLFVASKVALGFETGKTLIAFLISLFLYLIGIGVLLQLRG